MHTFLAAIVDFSAVCMLSWSHEEMCQNDGPFFYYDFGPPKSPVHCTLAPTGQFRAHQRAFGEEGFFELEEGEFTQVSWQDTSGGIVTAVFLPEEEDQWQISYRPSGIGESVDLLGLFLFAIEDFVDNGFDKLDKQLSTVGDDQAFKHALETLVVSDRKKYGDICRRLPEELRQPAPA